MTVRMQQGASAVIQVKHDAALAIVRIEKTWQPFRRHTSIDLFEEGCRLDHGRGDLQQIDALHDRVHGDGAGRRAGAKGEHGNTLGAGMQEQREVTEHAHVEVVVPHSRGAKVVGE